MSALWAAAVLGWLFGFLCCALVVIVWCCLVMAGECDDAEDAAAQAGEGRSDARG